MQGSFEKRVQEKLEELKLTPSEPVWKNIEKEIKPEKRRRFPFWIPFVIFLLAGTGWWLLSGKNQGMIPGTPPASVHASPVEKKSPNNSEANSDVTGITSAKKGGGANSRKPATPATTDASIAESRSVHSRSENASKSSLVEKTNRNTGGRSSFPVETMVAKGSRKQEIAPHTEVTSQETRTPESQGRVEKTPVGTPEGINEPIQQQASKQADTATSALADAAVKPAEKKAATPAKASDSAAAKLNVAALPKGWQKTLTVEGGWSRPTSGGLFAGGGRLADYSSSPSPSTGVSNGNGFGFPARVKAGAAFRVGVGLSKAAGKRTTFSVGLQYAYYSTRTRVGDFKTIDTAIAFSGRNVSLNGYYRNSNQQDYTNRYHLLEVPVSVGYRPLARLPLTFSVGALYGRLLTTNALAFNPGMNIYYKDKQATPKDFFAGFSSLQYSVLRSAGWRLDVGPVVQYHFSGLKKDSTTSQHLSFAGLKTTFHF